MRPRIRRSTVVLGACILAVVSSTRWVRVNVSPSVPLGLYALTPVTLPLAHGMLAVLTVPASMQRWHVGYAPLLKPIVGLPGDTVCYQEHGLFVNRVAFGLVYETVQGEPLPHIVEGCQVVQPGQVFLASHMPRSLDGRYFGPVLVADLTALALPLFTW